MIFSGNSSTKFMGSQKLPLSLIYDFFPKDALNFDNKDGGWRQRVTGLRRVINNNYNYYQLTEFS